MPSTSQLKGRIRSVKSTKQITKAMQMVAASKMRRAQEAEKATLDYTRAASEILTYLQSQGVTSDHPLFAKRPMKRRLIILIASDKGLAGAYNSNVFKSYINLLRQDRERGVKSQTIVIGRKASQFVSRLHDVEVVGTYADMPDHPDGREFYAILATATDRYRKAEVDAVTLIYTQFVSSITQTATWERLLPAGTPTGSDTTAVTDGVRDAAYEPSPEVVFDGIAQRLVGAKLFQALLDARASEHSMRMLAMKNATDNATDLIDDLTLAMNKARQAAITQELAEISGGAEAMK